MLVVLVVFFLFFVFVNGGFEFNFKVCVNVGKEINWVSIEMKVVKLGI